MRANSPSSIFVSLSLHGFAVLLILAATWFTAIRDREAPHIIELVAGPPTAPDELVAPALGNSTKPIKLEVPKVELVPTMPEPEPVVESKPEQAEVAPPPPEKAKPKAPDKPKVDTSIAKEMKKAQRMSYQEYIKKHPTPKTAASAPSKAKTAKVPKIDAQGIAQGVKGGSTANTRGGGGGKALTREQAEALDVYISLLLQELKRAHEPPAGVNDKLEAKVSFDITASGAILNPKITKSSGDKEFDRSVIEAFLRMRSIGPTPNRRSDTWTVTFKMSDLD